MRTLLITLLLFTAYSTAQATTWKYYAEQQKHTDLRIQDWDGQYRIFGYLYYTDSAGHDEFVKWAGLIERLPNGRFSENGKIIVKRAMAKFNSGVNTCMVPIEISLYLSKGKGIDGFYIESKIPWKNVRLIKDDPSGRCQEPQYYWARDPNPYWVVESWQ